MLVALMALINLALVVNTLRAYKRIEQLERECNLRAQNGGILTDEDRKNLVG
jgi:hypothetical protein